MVSVTAIHAASIILDRFLGALLLCGVGDVDGRVQVSLTFSFLGALLLCGVGDTSGKRPTRSSRVSRSSSALWCR